MMQLMLEKVSNMKYATILYQQWNNFATFSIVTDVIFFFFYSLVIGK